MWFLEWGHSNVPHQQAFQNSVMTFLWHFVSTVLMICLMFCVKGIWLVNSRTVFESFRRCQVCWLSEVSDCMELLCYLMC